VNTPPVSPPVKPPRPAPLLWRITLATRAMDVIINPIFRYVDTKTSQISRGNKSAASADQIT